MVDILLLDDKSHKINRKSQAAIEFMMTYGWAIMIVTIAILVLYYTGITQNKTVSSSCILSAGFYCKDLKLTTTGVYVEIQNSLGHDLNTMTINIKNSPIVFLSVSLTPGLKDGERKLFFVEASAGNTMDLNKRFRGDLMITYNKPNSVLLSSSTGYVSGSVEETGPVQGMIAYWKFDESSGNTMFDSSNYMQHGTRTGTLTNVGKYGNARYFTVNSGNFVTVPDSNILDIGTSDFTVAAWVYTSNVGSNGAILSKTLLGFGTGYYFSVDNQRLYFEISQNPGGMINWISSSSNNILVTPNIWHHIAITFQRNGNAVFYVDGVQDGSTSISSINGDLSNSRPLLIGESEGAVNHIDAIIDEVKIFNRVLSASEINSIK